MTAPELRACALQCLTEPDPMAKVAAVYALSKASEQGACLPDPSLELTSSSEIPGRPERPELVPPLQVGRRAMNTPEGRAMLIHALAHIEFNAINLALDAIWRFAGMPAAYYTDWLQVAKEEAYQTGLRQRMEWRRYPASVIASLEQGLAKARQVSAEPRRAPS